MRTDRINQQNFRAIITTPLAEGALFDRLNSPKQRIKYIGLKASQKKSPLDIVLTTTKEGSRRLQATIKNSEGTILEITESFCSNILGLSPIRFIKNICKTSNKLTKNYKV